MQSGRRFLSASRRQICARPESTITGQCWVSIVNAFLKKRLGPARVSGQLKALGSLLADLVSRFVYERGRSADARGCWVAVIKCLVIIDRTRDIEFNRACCHIGKAHLVLLSFVLDEHSAALSKCNLPSLALTTSYARFLLQTVMNK